MPAAPPLSRWAAYFRAGPRPFSRDQCFMLEDWHVWCGDVVRDPGGQYHLFYSRWPRDRGHEGWVTHSEIARATGESLAGPFVHRETIFARDDHSPAWDAHCFHNVIVRSFEGKYFLYYMGNRGDGDWWVHRNHQRIGVAMADSPAGPWKRMERPVLDISPGSWDGLMVSNPTVTRTPNGRYLMIYKGVAEGPAPAGGRVLHGVAWADSPTGPFIKHPHPIMDEPGVPFAFEDPCLWCEDDHFFCIVKTMGQCFSPDGRPRLLLMHSQDALSWTPGDPFVLLGLDLVRASGGIESFERVERPQLLLTGEPDAPWLLVAVKPPGHDLPSYNIRLAFADGSGSSAPPALSGRIPRPEE